MPTFADDGLCLLRYCDIYAAIRNNTKIVCFTYLPLHIISNLKFNLLFER